MKTLILSLVLLISFGAFACEKREAQFIGKLKVIGNISADGCQMTLEAEDFREHIFCPLLLEDVFALKITETNPKRCESLDGSRFGGYLILKTGTDIIEIE